MLFRVAEASVERPDGIVRDVVFPAVGGERVLHELVKECKATGLGFRRKLHQAMRRSYQAHYRRLLPPATRAIPIIPVGSSRQEFEWSDPVRAVLGVALANLSRAVRTAVGLGRRAPA